MSKKNTYVYNPKITIAFHPSIHFECASPNSKEGLVEARKFLEEHVKNLTPKELTELLSVEIEHGEHEIKSIKTLSGGRANQYHSTAECKLCSETEE